MEVEMKIRGLMMDPVTQMPIVVLKDVQGQSVLPIWVGAYEANAIALEIEKVATPRPMTHDLLKNVLLGLDVHVQKIVVNDLRDDTFFALIWVGVPEANAIALEMEKVTTPRPMTHDLIKNVLTGLEAQVHKVVVTELREDTFYAVIWLERGGEVISIDSRPSDALALALRVDCPIFVDDLVLKTSKQAANASDRLSTDELRKWLEGLNDEDLGKYKM